MAERVRESEPEQVKVHVLEAELMTFQEALKIDKNDLDTCLMNQPEVYARVGAMYAQACSKRDYFIQKHKEEMAAADRHLRSGTEKVTDARVLQEIQLDPAVGEAKELVLKWTKIAALWEALKASFEQRSYALKDLVQLYIAGYFGDQVGRGDRNDVRSRDGKQGRERMNEERTRRRDTD